MLANKNKFIIIISLLLLFDTFFIKANCDSIEEIEYIKIYSIEGKEISSEITELNSLQSGIKVNCKPGMYFLETKIGKSVTKLKIMVN